MNLSSPGVGEICLQFKKHTKEPNKEQSGAARKKLSVEFNVNIIFSNNSNNNADGCFKLHRYTEVCFFICMTMGNYPLITGIAIRVSVEAQKSKNNIVFERLFSRNKKISALTEVEEDQYSKEGVCVLGRKINFL